MPVLRARRGRRWLAGGLLVGVGALGLVRSIPGGRVPAPAPASRAPAPPAPVATLSEAAALPEAVREPTPSPASPAAAAEASEAPLGHGAPARDFLAAHYGARWPEVEAKIEAYGGVDLDMPYFQRPWEEVEGDFARGLTMHESTRKGLLEARLRWPEALSEEFLREEFGGRKRVIDASDVLAVEVLVGPWNEEIVALATRYAEEIDAEVHRRWARGDYLRAPFTTGGLDAKTGFHSVSTGGHGWAVTITLTSEECPDIVALEHQIEVLGTERDRAVLDYLAAKPLR